MDTQDQSLDPSPDVSRRTHLAIVQALEAQTKSRRSRWLKIIFMASLTALALTGILFTFWVEHFSTAWIVACVAVWVFLVIGFGMYFYPQPHLTAPTYWGAWSFAKLFVAMTVATVLQLVLCPHFALLHLPSTSPFTLLAEVTEHYRHFGGLAVCIFLCGATFALVGAIFAFFFVAKSIVQSRPIQLIYALGLSLLAQLPVAILQLSHEEARPYFWFWLLGSASSLILSLLLFKWLGGFMISFYRRRNAHNQRA